MVTDYTREGHYAHTHTLTHTCLLKAAFRVNERYRTLETEIYCTLLYIQRYCVTPSLNVSFSFNCEIINDYCCLRMMAKHSTVGRNAHVIGSDAHAAAEANY